MRMLSPPARLVAYPPLPSIHASSTLGAASAPCRSPARRSPIRPQPARPQSSRRAPAHVSPGSFGYGGRLFQAAGLALPARRPHGAPCARGDDARRVERLVVARAQMLRSKIVTRAAFCKRRGKKLALTEKSRREAHRMNQPASPRRYVRKRLVSPSSVALIGPRRMRAIPKAAKLFS